MKHKVLIGFMGCGKSSVSDSLGKLLGWKVLDTDRQIEQEQGQTISHIFETCGEACFRLLESELLERLAKAEEPLVIATGGGIAVHPENRELLKKLGDVIWLQVQPETVLARLADDTTRPLLQGKDKEAKVRALLEKRRPFYEAAADMCIVTDDKTPEQIAETCLERIKQR